MRFGMVGTSGLWTKLILAFAPNQLSHFSRKMRPSGPTPLIHFWLNQQPPVSSFSLNRKKIWWAQVDSNHRPHAYQACALTTWAMRPLDFSGYLPFSSSFSGTWKLNNISHTHKRWPEISETRVFPFLHRKEVIQPHLPIRLPCYDFTPIIDPTFGGGFLR